MDVHPPHHPLLTWRDFFVHIATITIGLLIALALEAAVEALHHRHIVREARENIRRELEADQTNARQNLTYVQADAGNMRANMIKARTLRDGSPSEKSDIKDMHFNFTWNSFNQSAWLSARDSGALTYMPSDEVQRDADMYAGQELVDKEAVDIFTHQSELAAPLFVEPDINKMPRDEIQQVLMGTAVVCMRLNTLQQMLSELDKDYATRLQGR